MEKKLGDPAAISGHLICPGSTSFIDQNSHKKLTKAPQMMASFHNYIFNRTEHTFRFRTVATSYDFTPHKATMYIILY
jgi:hypothetical protein